jgi:hypothetical protein
MRRLSLAIVIAISIWATALPAKAEFSTGLIGVDFKLILINFPPPLPPQVGGAVIGADGDVWNTDSNFLPHTTGVLTLAKGLASNAVAYSLSGATNIIIGQGTGFASTPYASLMADGFTVAPGSVMTIAFNGLTPLQPYDLYFYSSFANPSGNDVRATTFTIAGTSMTATTVGAPSAFVEGNNYVHFSSQPANAAGQITVSIQGVGGNLGAADAMGGIVNGFQISPVPEPTALVLFAAGAIGVLAIHRSRLARSPK